MKNDKTPLFNRLYRLHLRIIKDLNNSHIFVQKIIPLIEEETIRLENSLHKENRTFQVPSRKGKFFNKEAFRTDLEVKELLMKLANSQLFENLLVTNISRFESYLFQTLKVVIEAYPEKININIPGISPLKTVPTEVIINSKSLEQIISYLIAEKITAISYAKPTDYIHFISETLSINTTDEAFMDYIEMKATRDIIVHNSGIINSTYLAKTTTKARGADGESILVDRVYFDRGIATMKRISGIIKRDTEKKFN